jgi:hypothetical protein
MIEFLSLAICVLYLLLLFTSFIRPIYISFDRKVVMNADIQCIAQYDFNSEEITDLDKYTAEAFGKWKNGEPQYFHVYHGTGITFFEYNNHIFDKDGDIAYVYVSKHITKRPILRKEIYCEIPKRPNFGMY